MLAGCSIRVTGVVTDRSSGKPIPLCAVGVRDLVVHTDQVGAYVIKVRSTKKELEFSAAGYEPQVVAIQRPRGTRHPRVDAQLLRDRASSPEGARFDPYTGQPLVPRFDPYTGRPLKSAPAAETKN